MKYALTKGEKETTLLYNQTHEPAIISTYDSSLQHRLACFAKRFPDCCKRIDKQRYSDYAQYAITKSRVSIRILPPRSDEQKKAASDQAQRQMLGRNRCPQIY